jgi:molybdopterin molybdotransferase
MRYRPATTSSLTPVRYAAGVATLRSIDEALALVLERVRPLPAEEVPLAEAAGRVTAEPARAHVDLPPFPSSAMDGFALRAEDAPGRLPIAGRIAAGRPAPGPLEAGTAMAIATGGVVPDGADAVVPIELVRADDEAVEIPEIVPTGANVRPRGGDTRAGDAVVQAGVRLGPAQLGALAAAGVASVRCVRRPRAAVLATGTELRTPGEPLEPGQVYEANGVVVRAGLEAEGAEVVLLPRVTDDPEAHRDAIARGLEEDVFVTSGGVSVGPHDLVRGVAAELGVEEVLWGVAVKPGKPLFFGIRGSTLVFGLPGNPVSSLVGLELFVRPAVRALQGLPEAGPRWLGGVLGASVRRNPARDELLRARSELVADGTSLEPLGGQESHMIVRAAAADALVLVPRGEGEIAAGRPVRYLQLS